MTATLLTRPEPTTDAPEGDHLEGLSSAARTVLEVNARLQALRLRTAA